MLSLCAGFYEESVLHVISFIVYNRKYVRLLCCVVLLRPMCEKLTYRSHVTSVEHYL